MGKDKWNYIQQKMKMTFCSSNDMIINIQRKLIMDFESLTFSKDNIIDEFVYFCIIFPILVQCKLYHSSLTKTSSFLGKNCYVFQRPIATHHTVLLKHFAHFSSLIYLYNDVISWFGKFWVPPPNKSKSDPPSIYHHFI